MWGGGGAELGSLVFPPVSITFPCDFSQNILTSLSLSFFICKMGMMVPTHGAAGRAKPM